MILAKLNRLPSRPLLKQLKYGTAVRFFKQP